MRAKLAESVCTTAIYAAFILSKQHRSVSLTIYTYLLALGRMPTLPTGSGSKSPVVIPNNYLPVSC